MDSYMDHYRTGPDTIGGCYMRLFWHPVYRSEDLKCGWPGHVRVSLANRSLSARHKFF